jgi:hypothetical protein
MSDTKIHLFEHAGLGKHPFILIEVYSIPSSAMASSNPMAYQDQVKAMPSGVGCGSCAYCSTPLIHNFIIKSSDGKKSAVGCDCIKKVGDSGLIEAVKLAQREQRRKNKEAKRVAEILVKQQSERDENGGLTDHELLMREIKKVTKKRDKKLMSIKELIEPFIDAMRASAKQSDFAYSMFNQLKQGDLNMYPKAILIITEMTTKYTINARKGSKAFTEHFMFLDKSITNAIKAFNALPNPREVNLVDLKNKKINIKKKSS